MQITITAEAQKQYKRFPRSAQTKIKKKLNVLKDNPLLGKKLEGELAEYRSLRAWPYRIIYSIDETKEEVIVKTIIHRQGAYK